MSIRLAYVPPFPFHLGLLVLTGAAAGAAPQFGESQELTDILTEPEVVRSADLDGDGRPDLLASSETDGVVVWYRNLGDGDFGEKQIVEAGVLEPNFVNAADLDGDGTLDVYAGSIADGSVRWYRGLGNGVFDEPNILSNPLLTLMTLVQAADVDSDGDLDLLLGRSGSNGLRWHENLGSGQFRSATIFPFSSIAPVSAQMADMDGDGRMDLVYDHISLDTLFFRRGLGGGSFGQAIDFGLSASFSSTLRLADLDGDGFLDIVYLSPSHDEISWVPGLGSDGFLAPQTLATPTTFGAALELADLDSDGDLDVAVGLDWSVSWIENLGSGEFASLDEFLIVDADLSMASGDFDADGHLDLAISSRTRQVSWTRNLGGATAFAELQPVSSFVYFPSEPVLADVDGDGDLDALSTSYQQGRISWYENTGGGAFAPEELLVLEEHLTDNLRVGDLDGDGDLDLVWHIRGDRAIRWLEQLSPQAWAAPAEIAPLPAGPRDLALTDLDQDGDLDIVQPLVAPNGIYVYENLGGADFAGPIILPNVGVPTALAVGPLTTSGRPDLTLRAEDGRITWYRNAGQLTFAPPTVVAQASLTAFEGGDLVLADLSGNAKLDLAWNQNTQINWKENLGQAVFGTTQAIQTDEETRYLHATDLDTDGDTDLIFSEFTSGGNVVTLLNAGGQLGSPSEIAGTDRLAQKAATGDIDGDGDVDLLLTFWQSFETEWLPGEALSVVGSPYCGTPVANSTGQPGSMFASGDSLSAANEFTLRASQLPAETLGIFLVSPNQGLVPSVPGSVGTLCLGASIGRFNLPNQVRVTSLAGTTSLEIDLAAIPTPDGQTAVQVGETWNFQLWYRDQDPTPTSNFTQGVSVLFE